MKYILIEVIERNISTPELFDTFDAAHAKMEEYYNEACAHDDNAELGEWTAFCENMNHDNCDWSIFKIE